MRGGARKRLYPQRQNLHLVSSHVPSQSTFHSCRVSGEQGSPLNQTNLSSTHIQPVFKVSHWQRQRQRQRHRRKQKQHPWQLQRLRCSHFAHSCHDFDQSHEMSDEPRQLCSSADASLNPLILKSYIFNCSTH